MSQAQDRLGEILAAHRLGRDALVLLGWSASAYNANGTALAVKRQQGKGRFATASWPDDDQQRHWFLIVIHAPEAGTCQAGDGFQLHGAGGDGSMVAYCPPSILDAEPFAGELCAKLRARAGDAADFLVKLLAATPAAESEPVCALTLAAIDQASDDGGRIEVLGKLEGQGLLLQGWVRDVPAGDVRLLIDSGSLQEYGARFATYPRPDIIESALGFVGVVAVKADESLPVPRRAYIRLGGRFLRLALLPDVIRLRDEDVQGHLSGLMTRLGASSQNNAAAPAVRQTQFSGRDTVSDLSVPVRVAVDLVARVPGAGWYLTGWLLDPLKLVSSVTLRGPAGLSQRLDADWTRLPREDVSKSMREDALFAGRLSHDMHGFTVFVPADTDERAVWLELDVSGPGVAFMPATITTVDDLDDRITLLSSIDLHKASADTIIERQLGPLFLARGKAAPRAKKFHSIRAGANGGTTALIVPIVEDGTKSKIVASHMASSELPRGTRTVFVLSPVLAETRRSLPCDLDFYGVDAEVIVADGPVDRCEAIEIGVAATQESRLVFLAPQAHGIGRQWLPDLIAALGDAAKPIAVSPTLLYEDGSIRYAGIESIAFSDTLPYVAAIAPRAGYPRGGVPRGPGGPTFAGALECCAMTRAAFVAAGGFGAGYALDLFKGLDLFLRLRAAGVPILWTGQTELYALDDARSAAQHWSVVGAQVDGWAFKAAWQAGLLPRQIRRTDEPAASIAVRPAISLADVPRTRLRAAAG